MNRRRSRLSFDGLALSALGQRTKAATMKESVSTASRAIIARVMLSTVGSLSAASGCASWGISLPANGFGWSIAPTVSAVLPDRAAVRTIPEPSQQDSGGSARAVNVTVTSGNKMTMNTSSAVVPRLGGEKRYGSNIGEIATGFKR